MIISGLRVDVRLYSPRQRSSIVTSCAMLKDFDVYHASLSDLRKQLFAKRDIESSW
ncbi:uncharacterized protein BDW43DRAFT_263752 [Aspergillus alliaceus]|uniref:uncharacterized protein n=1 Tax=Petromyces alliaceus TaxID=209559 RepID=UPI0012A5FCE4|nr:uncharacterized protein BDW43DRAFT_263752 [Aspergillus alliaceus]KAB8237598.1 hypothetical protein BDW43DRAFT_263752 [Aspergillus alliaceus]